jgi:hypothetical protein
LGYKRAISNPYRTRQNLTEAMDKTAFCQQ